MASAQWNMLADRFRQLMGTLRALVPQKSQIEDQFDEALNDLDNVTYDFPDDMFNELYDQLMEIEDDSYTGPVTPLPTGAPAAGVVAELIKQIAQLNDDVSSAAGSGADDEDDEGDEDDDEDDEDSDDDDGDGDEESSAAPAAEEPAAAKVLGEAGPGKSQTYRGDIRGVVGVGDSLAFVTVHPEGVPTALYWLDVDKLTLQQDPLPCGGLCLAADGNTVYVGGTDRKLYECGRKAPKVLAGPFTGDIAGIVPLAKKRLAVLNGKQVAILSDKDGSEKQVLDLPDTGTCLSADKSGYWLAVGTTKGIVAVFDGEGGDEFALSESAKLHDGAVTVIKFEPEELRFFSSGADNKLYTTFARGSLEPEDKGRTNMHEDVMTSLVHVPGDRFVTGSRDATLKNWPRPGAIKPSTLKDIVGRVVSMTLVTVYNQPHVAVACDDNSIRLLKLDKEGKFPDAGQEDVLTAKVTGAAEWVREELGQRWDPKRREKALKVLAEWKDSASIDILGQQLTSDPDNKIRETIAELLVKSDSPRVVKILERAIGHGDGKVRLTAFKGLHERAPQDLGPIDLALKTGQVDVGVEGVKSLETLSKNDDQALTRLVDALDHGNWDVRKTALATL
ncbi:MAG: HEAT repeat domain-containing protein, partial [Gemmataceae bacterium]|nr:HEAT repeat domain-containing protein [Gemmataceae bacterium]